MTRFLVLAGYELRRHRASVLAACAMLLPLPIVHRMAEGHWGFWTGDWKEGGALFAQFIIAPVLAAALALSGWAGERAAGTLGWLYTRPVPAWTILTVRLIAVFAAILAFVAIAFTLLLRDPRTLVVLPVGVEPLRLLGLAPIGIGHWFALMLLIITAGMLASALAATPGSAVRGFLVGMAAAGVIMAVSWSSLRLEAIRWSDAMLAVIHVTQLLLWALAAGLGAWAAVRVAPLDRSRYRRAAIAAAPAALLGCFGVSVLGLDPVHFGLQSSLGARELDEGVELHLVRSTAMRPGGAVPQLRDGSGRSRTVRRTGPMAIQKVFVNRERGGALLPHFYWGLGDPGWSLVDASGGFVEVTFPPEVDFRLSLIPFGWSPKGTRFAWIKRSQAGDDLVVLDQNLVARRLEVSLDGTWSAAWLDEDHVLIGPEPERLWTYGPWDLPPPAASNALVLDVRPFRGRSVGLSHGGRQPSVPALMTTPYARRPWTEAPPRIDGRLVALVAEPPGLALMTIESLTARAERVGFIDASLELRRAGFGNSSEGQLVWLETLSEANKDVRVMVLDSSAAESRSSCTLTVHPETEYLRWRGTAGARVVWEEGTRERFYESFLNSRRSVGLGPTVRYLACDLGSGESAYLDDVGPSGLVSVASEGMLTPEGMIAFEALARFRPKPGMAAFDR